MDALSFAQAGLRAASVRIAARAENIANVQTGGYRAAIPEQTATLGGPEVRVERAAEVQTVDAVTGLVTNGQSIETDIVDLIQSKFAYKANATVIKTADELNQSLLDILA